jgi:radical SAM protein with 4Fe4S-binding SPASM domain
MGHFLFHNDSVELAGLRGEIALEVSAERGDILSVDIYGTERVHPEKHFAYWNCKLPGGRTTVAAELDLNRVSFHSVVFLNDGKRMTYADHWINPDFIFPPQLDISVTLWRGDKQLESRTFKASLSPQVQEQLAQALLTVRRIDASRLFSNHFCEEEVPLPKLLVIESTSRCNLKCPMCPRTIEMSPSGEYGDLDESILPNLEGAIRSTASVCLSSMGKPLLNRRLPAISERIKSVNPLVQVPITTNGSLLSESVAESLIKCGIDSVNVSIDAADPAIYAKIRVGANLAAVKNNISTLNKLKDNHASARPGTSIAYVAGHDNIAEMQGIVNMADELNMRNVSLAIMDDFTLTRAYRDRLNLDDTIVAKGRDSFAAAEAAARQKGINLIFEMPIQFFHFLGIRRSGFEVEDLLFDNDLPDSSIERLGLQKGCQVPWQDSFVAHNGDVHPCCVSPRVLGNVKEKTFEEIWNGEKYRAFRKNLKSCKTNEECRKCRRAIWNRAGLIEAVRDWMAVGRSETHGLGWGTMSTDDSGTPFRTVSRKATFFLRNSGKPCMSFKFGNSGRRITEAEISINNDKLGTVTVPYGWQTEYFDVSRFTGGCNCTGPDIQKQLLAMDETECLLKIDVSVPSGAAPLKVGGAALLDEHELDETARTYLQSGRRLMSPARALIRQAGYYADRIRKRVFGK